MTTKQMNPLRGVAAAAIAAALSLSLVAVAQAKPRNHHHVYNYVPDPYDSAPNPYLGDPSDPPHGPFTVLPGYDGSTSNSQSGVRVPGYHGSNGG